MSKEFKGVIRNWRNVDGRIEGIAAFHVNAVTFERIVEEAVFCIGIPVVEGLPMRTSPVVSTVKGEGVEIVETANSLYVLIEPISVNAEGEK